MDSATLRILFVIVAAGIIALVLLSRRKKQAADTSAISRPNEQRIGNAAVAACDEIEHPLNLFMLNSAIFSAPELEQRDVHPVTRERFDQLMAEFARSKFRFPTEVNTIYIHSAKMNLPKHSYAHGFLYAESPDFVAENGLPTAPIGTIDMEIGGSDPQPRLSVKRHNG